MLVESFLSAMYRVRFKIGVLGESVLSMWVCKTLCLENTRSDWHKFHIEELEVGLVSTPWCGNG